MNLTNPGELKAVLERHGLFAKKGLGQHFLCSSAAVNAIVARTDGCKGALEIGPGPGVLTRPLTEGMEKVLALELDQAMVEVLEETAPEAEVLQQDALKADLSAILQALPEPRAVVSNLPYYITAPLITAIASAKKQFHVAVLMMQKEVGLKILAPVGDRDRGSFSVFLQNEFEIGRVANVPAGAFLPPPKVDSIVLEFKPKATDEDESFYDFVRKGFTQPRKTLANNLSTAMNLDRPKVEGFLETAGLDAKIRAQMLSIEQWKMLWNLHRDSVT